MSETSILRKLCEWMTTISLTFSDEKLQMNAHRFFFLPKASAFISVRFNPDSSVFKSTASINCPFAGKFKGRQL